MTVIAARKDGKKIQIAWDSFIGDFYSVETSVKVSKKIEGNNFTALFTGDAADGALFAIYAKSHAISQVDELGISSYLLDFKNWKNKNTGNGDASISLIVVLGGRIFALRGLSCVEHDRYVALGAGGEIAHTAMFLGQTAESACATACAISNHCATPVYSEDVK